MFTRFYLAFTWWFNGRARYEEWRKWLRSEIGCFHTFHRFNCQYCVSTAFAENLMWGNIYFMTLTHGLTLLKHEEVHDAPLPVPKGRLISNVRREL